MIPIAGSGGVDAGGAQSIRAQYSDGGEHLRHRSAEAIQLVETVSQTQTNSSKISASEENMPLR
jgi:hypothetical protein